MNKFKIFVPSETEILGLRIKVRLKKNLKFEGVRVNGLAHNALGLIDLLSTNCKAMLEGTYYHKIVHQILYSLEYERLNNNEKFVQGLSAGIYQVLKT